MATTVVQTAVRTATHRTAIHWFRRDFRVHDNTALLAATRTADAVVGVFVIDPRWFGAKTGKIGPHQASFWLESLRELQSALDTRNIPLVIRTHRDPPSQLLALARELDAHLITLNKEYEPDQLIMDERLTQEAARVGISVRAFKDSTLLEEEELLTGGGTPYSVFTPYKNAYLKKLQAIDLQPAGLPRKMPERRNLPSEPLPTAADLGFPAVTLDIPPGERAATNMLQTFCAGPIRRYKQTRDIPALLLHNAGTSRLSAHLNAGTLSIRQVMHATLAAAGPRGLADPDAGAFAGELIWRDFYRMILFHFPRTVSRPFQRNYAHVTWKNDPALIDAWSDGRTGYPLVDAAMKQIRHTGFMHNRLRMIAAMFLTKDLDVHWVIGERLFMKWLIDYDQACNVGGWQWAASTGTDAAPYFRVMNPILQSEKFDPEGEFIRHYLPPLQRVPTRFIHAPWEMPDSVQKESNCIIGRDYPAPIVDHALAKKHAIAKFQKRR